MSQKPETRFRCNTVKPFLKTLKNTVAFPIQQMAIHDDPDFLICIGGVFVALELKAEGGSLRPLQIYKLNEVTRTGGVALTATPQNWAKVKQILSDLDTKRRTAWK